MTTPDLSAVIPFRNRGPERLALAIRSLLTSTNRPVEVIVSDFGSDDPAVARDVADSQGASVVYTPSDHWSRSGALNAGFRAARAPYFLGADADIIWGPEAVNHALTIMDLDPQTCVAFECQFMGPEISVDDVTADATSWKAFDRASQLNPRWGVGMLFFPRSAFIRTNGYEARMRTYGYEDNDFSSRVRSLGHRIKWVGAGQHRAYHIWHERPGLMAKHDTKLAAEYAANRVLFEATKSVVRNVTEPRPMDEPLVTIAISTQNRADMLRTAISSVLCQTVQSFEVVVVDDGSTDHTHAVVEEFDDPRLRYFRQDNAGISKARNRALDEARGWFTAVMDDDDIMPPWRLERSIERIHAGEHGCVGSFVTFDDDSGQLTSWGDPYPTLLGAYRQGGFAGHPTWMVRTDVLRAFRYDESFTSAVDNNLGLRMLRSGIRLRHSGSVMNLRRVHPGQITSHDSAFQGRGAKLNGTWLRTGSTAKEWHEAGQEAAKSQLTPTPSPAQHAEILPYLPDHLVHRTITAKTHRDHAAQAIRAHLPRAAHVQLENPDGSHVHLFHIPDATWRECAFITTRPDTTITRWTGTPRTDASSEHPPPSGDPVAALLAAALESGLPHSTVTRFDPGDGGPVWHVESDAVHRIQITVNESGDEA
ncbi:glycosyltransferase [Phycicoccus jejuensis]|uniref:glycosyltransferase n=1 Tax=Phycicoccus jejuensis TaxID=367299 RepID=UPI00384C1534